MYVISIYFFCSLSLFSVFLYFYILMSFIANKKFLKKWSITLISHVIHKTVTHLASYTDIFYMDLPHFFLHFRLVVSWYPYQLICKSFCHWHFGTFLLNFNLHVTWVRSPSCCTNFNCHRFLMTQFHSAKFQSPCKQHIKLLKTVTSWLYQRSTISPILLPEFVGATSFLGQVSGKKGLIVGIHLSHAHAL